jgi:hypothetical protein
MMPQPRHIRAMARNDLPRKDRRVTMMNQLSQDQGLWVFVISTIMGLAFAGGVLLGA